MRFEEVRVGEGRVGAEKCVVVEFPLVRVSIVMLM